ncbi:helix-turn-helix domain-containing protein [Streptomyces sp. NPDC051976]|uniref:helix-turn-helix domain-containing protein n=1 Tax=Streptomyces sp. NPDC051976 TaxID=3154947 RepID=UPI0034420968
MPEPLPIPGAAASPLPDAPPPSPEIPAAGGPYERGRAVLAAVLREMVADRGVVAEVTDAARQASPEVAGLPVAENRRHIEVLLACGLVSFERPGGEPPRDDPVAARLGADRAGQGVPLTSLLRGVQAGRRRALQIGVARGRAAGVPDVVLLDAVLRFDRHAGAMERDVINGYHTAELELARTARDARTAVLRRLLHGRPGPPSAEQLAGAGLSPGVRYHCVVSQVTDPAGAGVLERRLAVPGGLFGLVDGRLAGVVPRPPAGPPDGAGPLLVVSPAVPLDGVAAVYGLCVDAAHAAAAHGRAGGVHGLTDLAGEVALAARPVLADLLAGDLLGGLDPRDAFHHQLARTALVHLDLGRRLDLTAAALHVHPNTVRYRLARLSRLLGQDPAPEGAGVLSVLRWWWALRTWLDGAGAAGVTGVGRAAEGPDAG